MTENKTDKENHNTLHIPSREEFHRHYGGRIYQSDFETEYIGKTDEDKGSRWASRIEQDRIREEKLYKAAIASKARQNKGVQYEE